MVAPCPVQLTVLVNSAGGATRRTNDVLPLADHLMLCGDPLNVADIDKNASANVFDYTYYGTEEVCLRITRDSGS